MNSSFLSPLSLDGVWNFRFDEGKSIEDVWGAGAPCADKMIVPGCFDMMPQWYLKRGTARYERTFHLDVDVDAAWLHIDGMGLRGRFAVDGRDLGTHAYPYAQLRLATGPLAAGDHTLSVALDNRFDWDTNKLVRPYYDFYFYGGFYHGVSLEFDNRTLAVRTRDLATGLVEIEARNFAAADFEADVAFDGGAATRVAFRNARASLNVPNPTAWSPDAPNLHTVAVRVAGAPEITARFGLRTIEARNRKVFLNGKEIFLKGFNRHESHIEFGAATKTDQMLRDLHVIKGMGANFIRGAHYQQNPRFLDLCDEVGMLIWEESLGWGNGQNYTDLDQVELKDPAFIAAQIHETREMVRESINHPCIIISGFLNEIGSGSPEAKSIVDQLIETIRAEDTGHLITFACNCSKWDICHENTDIVAFNSYPGTIPAFPGLASTLKGKVEEDFNSTVAHFRAKYPNKPIMISESGCGAHYGVRDPMAVSWYSEEFQEEYLRDIFETLWANPDVVGFAIWQFADNRTYSRNSEDRSGKYFGCSNAGVVNDQRLPKVSVPTVKEFFAKK